MATGYGDRLFQDNAEGGAEGFEIYVSTLKAVDLVGRCAFDRWSPENPLGYQRLPVAGRLGDKRGGALRYLLREIGCFPTSILLNVRGEIGFKPEGEEGGSTKGRLDLGEERLWVIDGQHRVEALRLAMERGPVTGESLAAILGGLLKKTPGHSNPVFRQSLDVGVWSREGRPRISAPPSSPGASLRSCS